MFGYIPGIVYAIYVLVMR
ncbi:hypothetical protein LINPERPRIM_LOCUS32935 [Linum perenne]